MCAGALGSPDGGLDVPSRSIQRSCGPQAVLWTHQPPRSHTCELVPGHRGDSGEVGGGSALLLQAMSGHDPSDPGSSTAPVEDYVTGLDHSPDKPRLGLLREFFMEVCYPEVHEHTESVVQALEDAGAIVRKWSFLKASRPVSPATIS